MTDQPRATLSAERYAARFTAAKAALQRHYCGVFKFWRTCPLKSCRRARACRGDARDCLARGAHDVARDAQWQARQQVLAATPACAGPPERMAREFMPDSLASVDTEPARRDQGETG